MSIEVTLKQRSNSCCELCGSENSNHVFPVGPEADNHSDKAILLCDVCNAQIQQHSDFDTNHWRCLNDSMWSQVPAVQVVSYRMLHRLSSESWAQDLLEMIYLEDDVKAWANKGISLAEDDNGPTKDCNGTTLQEGDTVHLIKDLVVKGANFTAKRGTAVRGISLTDNPEYIEGRVNGTRIVLVAAYLKKSV